MFHSQVIKCYELPYCTLEIFANNRFCLLIENLDSTNESSVKLNSDRAQLTELINTLKQQLPALSEPATPQQAKQTLYPVTLPNNNQSATAHLSWQQLSDLNKILDQYQTDVANNNLFVGRNQRRFWGICSLLLLLFIGGLITRWKWDASSSPQTATGTTKSLLPNPPSSSSSSRETNASPSLPEIAKTGNLQLSESLKPLDKLSPPTSIDPPSFPDLTANKPLPGQENNQKPTSLRPPKPANDPPSLAVPEFPSFPSPSESKPTPPVQPDTLFDQSSQVAEVRRYFQQQWNQSKPLTQHLEYQLIIDQNGFLQNIVPLGNAAQNHLPSLPFPSKNQPFVSPSTNETQQKIRLVFSPNGQVKTFLIANRSRSATSN